MQIRICNSKFPEDLAGVFDIVEFQRLCELELDGVALLRHRWRRNRVSLQQSMALAEDEGISDRSAGHGNAVNARFVHHSANGR